MVNKKQTLNFQTFFGLKELIINKSVIENRLNEIVEWSEIFSTDNPRHQEVRIIETFFSDTAQKSLLTEILNSSKKFKIRILILNPFGKIAEYRARHINNIKDPFAEINNALWEIINQINSNKNVKKSSPPSRSENIHQSIKENLQIIQNAELENLLEIRFYDELVQVPVYSIGQFVALGQLSINVSAVNNPWMLFVDNPNQHDDIYDACKKSFEEIWKSALAFPRKYTLEADKCVFVSYGHNQMMLEFVKTEIEKRGFIPRIFKESPSSGKTNIEKLENLINSSSCAIIILTLDDFKTRARQNVLHEMGWSHGKYDRDNVLILGEKGIDMPSNIDGVGIHYFSKNDLDKVSKAIEHFLVEEKFEYDPS